MINNEESCKNCIHKEVCHLKSDILEFKDRLENDPISRFKAFNIKVICKHYGKDISEKEPYTPVIVEVSNCDGPKTTSMCCCEAPSPMMDLLRAQIFSEPFPYINEGGCCKK